MAERPEYQSDPTGIYCGIPAGLDAFKTVTGVFKEIDSTPKAVA